MTQWICPGTDIRFMPDEIYQKDFSILEDITELDLAVREWREADQTEEMTLPFIQNLEAAALGCGIKKMDKYWSVGNYCFENLEELNVLSFDLLSDKRIQTMLAWIEVHREEKIIIEVEAPFSILSALINPMTLYSAMVEVPEMLEKVLEELTSMQENYIKALIKAGCKIISLADPAGSIDLIGLEMYKKFSGKAMHELIKNCEPYLVHSLIHLCGKTSYSMLQAGMIKTIPHNLEQEQNYKQLLFQLSKNKKIHCVGNACMNQKRQKQWSEIYFV